MTILAVLAMPALAEEQMNPIITSMPSVSIAPDARSGAMGDIGAATAPDLNSQHWNPAKYAFMADAINNQRSIVIYIAIPYRSDCQCFALYFICTGNPS